MQCDAMDFAFQLTYSNIETPVELEELRSGVAHF